MDNEAIDQIDTARKITLVSPDNYYTFQFTVEAGNQYVIGRSDVQSAFYPVVDLTDLGAYRMGVSRMHATLELVEDELQITDHSSNGTQVDGIHMQNGETLTIGNHSTIRLGELSFYVVIQS